MLDQWYYSHAQAVHGPVSGDELRRLAQTGGLDPVDLVWPVGWEPLDAVPAEAALRFPKPPPVHPALGKPALPPLPPWLPDLAEVLRTGGDPQALPAPRPESWLGDVRRVEAVEARAPSGQSTARPTEDAQ
jgi:hypothetical protein